MALRNEFKYLTNEETEKLEKELGNKGLNGYTKYKKYKFLHLDIEKGEKLFLNKIKDRDLNIINLSPDFTNYLINTLNHSGGNSIYSVNLTEIQHIDECADKIAELKQLNAEIKNAKKNPTSLENQQSEITQLFAKKKELEKLITPSEMNLRNLKNDRKNLKEDMKQDQNPSHLIDLNKLDNDIEKLESEIRSVKIKIEDIEKILEPKSQWISKITKLRDSAKEKKEIKTKLKAAEKELENLCVEIIPIFEKKIAEFFPIAFALIAADNPAAEQFRKKLFTDCEITEKLDTRDALLFALRLFTDSRKTLQLALDQIDERRKTNNDPNYQSVQREQLAERYKTYSDKINEKNLQLADYDNKLIKYIDENSNKLSKAAEKALQKDKVEMKLQFK